MRKSQRKKDRKAKRKGRQQCHRILLNFSYHVRKNVTRIAYLKDGWNLIRCQHIHLKLVKL